MKMSIAKDPAWINPLCRFYAAALWLYPRSHRERWGADMRQVFRDRCREAARDGHGPLRVVFADLLPDLVVSVGNEHATVLTEMSPMKRFLLVAALFVAVGLGLFRDQITVALLDARDYWKQTQAIADMRARDAHWLALAAAVERDRRNSSDDVAAAILYWQGADGRDSHRFFPGWPDRSAADSARRDAQLDRADAAFARALKAGDRWAMWLAINDCPARPAVCNQDASLARLRESDAENGATWLAELKAGGDAHDPVRQRNALARFAQATRYDIHYGDMERALFAAFDKLPLPARLNTGVSDSTATAGQLAEARRIDQAQLLVMGVWMPGYQQLFKYCHTKNAEADTERAPDCAAVGKLMAQSHDSTEMDVMSGLPIWLRAASPAVVPEVQRSIRNARWEMRALGEKGIGPDENSASSWLEWKQAWLVGGGERAVTRRLMQQHGLPLQAPPEFTLDPKYLDPGN